MSFGARYRNCAKPGVTLLKNLTTSYSSQKNREKRRRQNSAFPQTLERRTYSGSIEDFYKNKL